MLLYGNISQKPFSLSQSSSPVWVFKYKKKIQKKKNLFIIYNSKKKHMFLNKVQGKQRNTENYTVNKLICSIRLDKTLTLFNRLMKSDVKDISFQQWCIQLKNWREQWWAVYRCPAPTISFSIMLPYTVKDKTNNISF